MKNHSIQQSRKNNWKHALRKRRIAREILKWDYYNNLHQYSKNKIHCSCPLCKGKAENFGDNSIEQLSAADKKKIISINEQLEENMFDE